MSVNIYGIRTGIVCHMEKDLMTIKDTLLNEEYLMKIQEFTHETASNTAFSFWREADFWEYMAMGLSVLAILLAVITAVSQWKTERNTRMSLCMKAQIYESVFKSLLNDLYRIQCDIISLQIILMENDFQLYPSERCQRKMMLEFDDSNIDSFLVVFDSKYKNVAEDHYLMMHEINRLIRDYNVNIEILMDHLKDSSIDVSTKLLDFSITNTSIGFLSRKIIQTAGFIYGNNSDVGSSLTDYVKSALEFFQSDSINVTKYEAVINPVLNDYFKQIDIISTEDAMLLAYKLISYEIENSDSGVRRNLLKFKS